MKKEEAILLLRFLGKNSTVVSLPEDIKNTYKPVGLGSISKLDHNGKFYFYISGELSFICSSYSIINVQSFKEQILDYLILQLKEECRNKIADSIKHKDFPDLYHLLIKFYGL